MSGYSGQGSADVPFSLLAGQTGVATIVGGGGIGQAGPVYTMFTTTSAIRGFILTFTPVSTYVSGDVLAIRVLLGPGGSEVLLHGPITFVTQPGPSNPVCVFLPFNIPINTRISASCQNNTSALAVVFQVCISAVK